MLRDQHPLTWHFHQNTSRWQHNMQDVPDGDNFIPHFKEYPNAPFFPLPDTELPQKPLGQLITSRYSCRNYQKSTIPLNEIATVLKGGYGILSKSTFDNADFLERPVPSGGGLYPLELYIIALDIASVPQGIYHYSIISHGLEQINETEIPPFYIYNLFMNQPYLKNASAVFVITTCFERNMFKYGDRGYRYILLEAGHCAQNINLIAQGLGLGTLNLGGFFDHEVASFLDLDLDAELPLYGIALGKPHNAGKMSLRTPKIK